LRDGDFSAVLRGLAAFAATCLAAAFFATFPDFLDVLLAIVFTPTDTRYSEAAIGPGCYPRTIWCDGRPFESRASPCVHRQPAHGIEPARTRARGRVNRDQLAEIDLHWHDLRHEAACRWLAKGLDLRAIQLLLGHADLKTTQRYLNVTDDELRKAMAEKLWNMSAR
jgi:hypothetical protein